MRQLKQLSQVLDTLPPWAVAGIGIFPVLVTIGYFALLLAR